MTLLVNVQMVKHMLVLKRSFESLQKQESKEHTSVVTEKISVESVVTSYLQLMYQMELYQMQLEVNGIQLNIMLVGGIFLSSILY